MSDASTFSLVGTGGSPEAARVWRRFRRQGPALAGLVALAVIAATALLAPLLAPGDPAFIDLSMRERPPSLANWMGTDRLGRDVFGMVVWGGRVTLGVGLLAVTLGSLVGVAAGASAGYAGSVADALISRTADAMLAMPTFFLLVAVQALFPAGPANVVLIIGATSWMALTRIVRGQVLSLRARDFVMAAVASGAGPARVLWRHIVPNVSSQIIVYFTLGVADAILVESALSFLGLGVPPYMASWGNMLNEGLAGVLNGSWWIALFPGTMIMLTALSVNLIGDGLQESLFT